MDKSLSDLSGLRMSLSESPSRPSGYPVLVFDHEEKPGTTGGHNINEGPASGEMPLSVNFMTAKEIEEV